MGSRRDRNDRQLGGPSAVASGPGARATGFGVRDAAATRATP